MSNQHSRRFAVLASPVLIFALLAVLTGCASPVSMLVIRDVTVVDVVSSTARPNMSVAIRGDRITEVGSSIDAPPSAEVIDGDGKYLVPGLWDMHVHLAGLDPVGGAAETLVSYGVTGVRDMGGRVDALLRLRTEIEKGSRTGPTVLLAGNTLNGAAPADFHRIVASVEGARPAIDEQLDAGSDFIKIHNQLDPAVFHALAEEARDLGVGLVGHVPHGVSLLEASDAGMRSFEHAEALMEAELFRRDQPATGLSDALDRLTGDSGRRLFEAIAENGTYITPTLSAYRAFIEEQETAERKELGERLYKRLAEVIVTAHSAGVTILAGTDFRTDPGAMLHRELVLLRDAGLSNGEALQAATVSAASLMSLEAGTIGPGKEASLVLLNANPLEDIANVSAISAVILRGRYLAPEDLPSLSN